MDILEIFSEIANWLVLIYILLNVLGTGCFQTFDWILTFTALFFSYIIRYISRIIKEKGEST